MSKKRRTAVGYEGILLEPMTLLDPSRDTDGEPAPVISDRHQRAARHAEAVRQVAERVEALFKHYDIPVGNWKTLALALAFDHVAGFGTHPRRKKKIVETDWYLGRLYQFVEARKAERGHSASTVCENLHKMAAFQKEFPELRKAGPRRLKNLHSLAADRRGKADPRFYQPWSPSPMFRRYAEDVVKPSRLRGDTDRE